MKKTFVAELSGNHNNDFDLAIKTITAISETGADAVKVQTYKPESLTIKLTKVIFYLAKMAYGRVIHVGVIQKSITTLRMAC